MICNFSKSAGSYTFRIVKEGFDPMNATLNFTGQLLALTIMLLKGNSPTDNCRLLIIVIVVASVSVLFVIRRETDQESESFKSFKNN
jgi:hypothetical protein